MKTYIAALFLSSLLCGTFVFVQSVSAATIFTENFNNYTTNSVLNGQGGWLTSPAYIVTTSTVKEGAKAIFASGSSSTVSAIKSGTLLNDGQITVYVRRSDANQPGVFSFKLREGSAEKVEVRGNFGANGKFQYVDGSTGSYVNFGPSFNFETWYAIQIQWRSSDHSLRYNIDGGAWTSWVLGIAPWTTGLDTVELDTTNSIYWDAIQENLIGFIAKNPVLIVPGLTGTDITDGINLVWMNPQGLFGSILDDFMDPLQFKSDLSSIDTSLNTSGLITKKTFDLGLGKVVVFNYTDGLITELKNQGYIENQTLFTFPYDWRYGVSGKYPDGKTNADLLQQKITDILAQTGAQKVDVIAHSMGGLIVKQYAQNHVADNHIGKAIFVGVPSTGAPYAVKDLLVGDNLGSPFVNQDEIKKISANMPAIYDLLPSQQYYNAKGSYVKVIDEGTIGEGPITTKDLTYGDVNGFLTNDHQLNATAVANANNLHTATFDNFDLRTAGIDLYAIDGCRVGTVGAITEERYKNVLGQSFTDYKRPKMTPGDNTVPLESATNLPIDAAKKYYALTGEHAKLMSQDGARQEIVNLLSGSSLVVDSKLVTQDISKCNLNGKAISVFSPVDVSVTDQSGNTLGLASDGSIINTIPNADFEIWGEHKFLYLPTDDSQIYTINMQGTGAGTYTIDSQNISNSQVTGTEVFSNLPVTTDLTGTINLGVQTTLTVQQDSSSAPQTILPSSVISGDQTDDVLPPVSTVTLSGTTGQPGFYRSDVNVAPSALDAGSGVLSISYKIDGEAYVKVAAASANFSVTAEGAHTVTYFSTDNAGNNELEKAVQFTIDRTAPEVTMNFDQTIKDLRFVAADNISTPDKIIMVDGGSHVTFTDQAGNVLDVGFAQTNRKAAMKANIQSLSYNGQLTNLSSSLFSDSWTLDKQGLLKSLTQSVQSRPNYSIKAVYDGTKTALTGTDQTGKIGKTVAGLAVLKVTTNKGDFNWSYY